LKIDVAKRAINGDSRFDGENILVLTGERREESKARSKYDEVVPHGSNTKSRRVDQWRSILDWNETWVWAIMERWRIYPHPAYVLGWDRVSCALCIFAGPNQYASAQQILPLQFNGVSNMETRLGHTVNHERKKGEVNALPVLELASRGTSFIDAPQWVIDLALSKDYPMDRVFVPEDEMWELPQGAFKKTGCGPT
jgi:3'-phosphoadenosine 5'-phosphosulfate sulfotransferase (PAPS reductase)/FAD synthetase